MTKTQSRTKGEVQAATELIQSRRVVAEQLLALAEHLPHDDRALIEAIYHRGMRVADVARAAQVPPRVVQVRIDRLMIRLASPLYRFVASRGDQWPQSRREVASLIIMHGTTQREAANRLGVSLHRVRQEMMGLRVLSEQEQA